MKAFCNEARFERAMAEAPASPEGDGLCPAALLHAGTWGFPLHATVNTGPSGVVQIVTQVPV